jgi:Fe-S cluster assembly protein SufD
LQEDASLNYLLIEQGGELVKRNLSIQLEGQEAAAELTGLYNLSGKQKIIFDTYQNHLASNTKSNLLFKGVMDEGSYSLWKGNVFVAKNTQGVDGYQMNNNLLINHSAQAESIPGLEIMADDVRCSHGVTISDIDHEQLFYLKSRGIGEIAGKKLIVDGFTRDALRRIRSDEIREYAKKELGFHEEF